MSETKTPDLVFEDPPGPRSYDWDAVDAACRDKPNEWVRVFEQDRVTVVDSIRNGNNSVINRAKGYEVITRKNHRYAKDGGGERRVCDLYVRYVPDLDESRPAKRTRSKRA